MYQKQKSTASTTHRYFLISSGTSATVSVSVGTMLQTHSIVIHQGAVLCQILHVIDVEATDAKTCPVVEDVLKHTAHNVTQ